MTTWTEEITTLYDSLGGEIKKWKDGVHNEQSIYRALGDIGELLRKCSGRNAAVRHEEMPL